MATDLMVNPTPVVSLDARSSGINVTSTLSVQDAGGARFPTRHGMARLLPIRTGGDGRLVFVIDTFYGTRMAGHHAVLSGEGPRPLLSDATALPAGIEERIRTAYTTARHQELIVRRGDATFALELIPDNGGVTALWSELGEGAAGAAGGSRAADGQAAAALAAGATVDGDTVGCVILRSIRHSDGSVIDFECELSIAADDYLAELPRAGSRLGSILSGAARTSVVASLAQLIESRRPFRPPRGVFGDADLEGRCELRAMAFADRAVISLRLRPHTRSVVDLRENDSVSLTRREREILMLLAEGASTTEIARTLYLSTNTVRNHVRRLLSHLGASSRLEAVVIAAKTGLLELRRADGAG